jgi:Spy/CpxP family protein refolding chaperone
MTKLQAVNARHAPQMAALATRERETRQQLRAQMTSTAPDQATVGKLLDTLLGLQRQRIGLLESEQNELAAFLTPVQRAKYMGLQAQIKRRADQLRPMGQRPGRRAGNPPLR